MHPPDCPAWEYEHHPLRSTLTIRVSEALRSLRDGSTETLSTAIDSRRVHRHLFLALTPPNCDYFAGHYRGEHFRCLRFYEVQIVSDPRVGCPSSGVEIYITQLSDQISAGITALDSDHLSSDTQKLHYIVALAGHAFVTFLTVHPYANGNGHAGRLIVWSILGRFGYWPKRWTVEPRPPDPPYSDLIVLHRNGDKLPLEMYILQMLN